jgi:hypothetical protein
MKPNSRALDHTRGVSEVVGFILILGIMMAGIAIITLYGYPLLVKEEANSNIRNMEKNMIVLQNDVNSLAFKSVPYKETTIEASGGVLSVVNSLQSGQKFTISKGSNVTLPETALGELRFHSDADNAIISLTNGAVNFRYLNQNGSAMISEPRWYYDNSTSTLVIPIIDITSSNITSNSGISTVKMSITPSNPIVDNTSGDVKVVYRLDPINDFQYDNNQAWQNYLTGSKLNMQLNTPKPLSSGEYTLTGVNTLVIKKYTIVVNL